MGERIGLRAALGLGSLVLATFVAIVTEIVPVGLLPQLSRAFAVSESVAGLLVTVYAALVVVLAIPLTSLTRRIPRKPLLLGTVALYALGNAGVAAAPSFGVVVAGRVVGGVAHALFFSVWGAYASALVPPRLQGRALAVVAVGTSAGYVLGVPLVTSIGTALGWRAAFVALVVGGLLVLAVAAALLPGVPVSASPEPSARGPRRAIVGVAVANTVAFLAHYTLYTYVSAVLIDAGVPEAALGLVLLVLGAAGVLGLWLAGLVIDRRPRAGFLLALAVGAGSVATLLATSASAVGTIGASTVWLVTFGAIPTFCAAASLRTRSGPADLLGAVNNAASNIGIGGGAALGGAVLSVAGLPAVVVVATGAFAAAFVLVLVLRSAFPPAVASGP